MKRIATFVLCLLAALWIGGVNASSEPFAAQRSFAGEDLILNGSGQRTKAFFKLYTAGLYLRAKSSAADAIVKADEPMAMRLLITSSMITSEKMESAIREGFAKSARDNAGALQTRIDQFVGAFKPEIAEGDVYDIVYSPGKGTSVSKNGKVTATIDGLDFKQALFGIWLGEQPVQQDLKAKLLGQSGE